MSIHSSLRRRALALPVALVVALGAAGVVAAPAYADTTDPAASAAVDPNLDSTADADTDTDAAAADATAAADAAEPVTPAAPDAAPGDVAVDPAPEVAPAPAPAPEVAPAPAPAPEAVDEAVAAPFTVLTPLPGSTSLNRTVLFTGLGTDGSTITLTDGAGAPLPVATPVTVTGGAWTATLVYADDAANAQTVVVTQTTAGAPNGTQTVTFALPDPGVVVPFEVLTPVPGETQPTRTVIFSGTGTEGSIITILGADGQPLTPQIVVTAGIWLAPVTFTDDAPTAQTVTVTQTPEGQDAASLEISFVLPPAPALPAPVITSPTEGEIVTGTQVTFRGTGQPGAFIGLLVLPSSLVAAPAEPTEPAVPGADDEPAIAAAAAPAAAPAPANPADPVPVGADGTWSVTLALTAEDYTVAAIQSSDPAGATGVSEPSAPVSFSLQAPVPAAVPAVAASGDGPRVLAATGGEDVTGLFGIGILVMLAGAAAVVTSSRRRAMS